MTTRASSNGRTPGFDPDNPGSTPGTRTDWQSVISTAAVDQFTRHGRLGAFRLARRDLLALAGQVMRQDIPLDKVEGVIAIRCHVHCAPLDRAVVVDEWLPTS